MNWEYKNRRHFRENGARKRMQMHRLTHMFNLRTDARKLIFSLKKSLKTRTRVITEKENSPRERTRQFLSFEKHYSDEKMFHLF